MLEYEIHIYIKYMYLIFSDIYIYIKYMYLIFSKICILSVFSYADGITLLHLGVVEHFVRRASGCSFAVLQSPRPLWSFEHSGPMTLCACVDA